MISITAVIKCVCSFANHLLNLAVINWRKRDYMFPQFPIEIKLARCNLYENVEK